MTWKGNLSKTKKHCSSLKSNVDFIQSVNMEGRGGRNCSFLYGKSILSTSYSLWPFINYFCHDIYSKMFKNTLFPSIRFPPLLSIPLSLHSAPIIMIIMYNASAFSSFICECEECMWMPLKVRKYDKFFSLPTRLDITLINDENSFVSLSLSNVTLVLLMDIIAINVAVNYRAVTFGFLLFYLQVKGFLLFWFMIFCCCYFLIDLHAMQF